MDVDEQSDQGVEMTVRAPLTTLSHARPIGRVRAAAIGLLLAQGAVGASADAPDVDVSVTVPEPVAYVSIPIDVEVRVANSGSETLTAVVVSGFSGPFHLHCDASPPRSGTSARDVAWVALVVAGLALGVGAFVLRRRGRSATPRRSVDSSGRS